MAAAAAGAGPPGTPPPSAPGEGAPPPAWISSGTRSAWLAHGSYCWRLMCVDMIAPEARTDLPRFAARRGSTVRVHLRMAATSAAVSVDRRAVPARLDATRRVLSWTARRGGILVVEVKAAPGSAGYLARLRLR